MGEFFEEIWRGLAWISKKRGNFSRNSGRVGVDFQEAMVAEGKYGRTLFKNLERVCVDFKKQYWRDDTMGESFKKFGERLRGFQKKYWRKEIMGNSF